MSTFSTNLYELRVSNGYTLESLAKAINQSKGTNFTKSTFSKWEHGTTEPSFQSIVPIADFFNVSVDWLIGTEQKDQGKYSYVNSAAVAEIMLDPDSQELIAEINTLNKNEKKELLTYAQFLKKKREG